MSNQIPALRMASELECQQCWKPHAEEMRRLLSLALRHEAEAAQARRELSDAKALNQELLEGMQQIFDLPEDSRIHYKVARRFLDKAESK